MLLHCLFSYHRIYNYTYFININLVDSSLDQFIIIMKLVAALMQLLSTEIVEYPVGKHRIF